MPSKEDTDHEAQSPETGTQARGLQPSNVPSPSSDSVSHSPVTGPSRVSSLPTALDIKIYKLMEQKFKFLAQTSSRFNEPTHQVSASSGEYSAMCPSSVGSVHPPEKVFRQAETFKEKEHSFRIGLRLLPAGQVEEEEGRVL
jgi:hypothetical protein